MTSGASPGRSQLLYRSPFSTPAGEPRLSLHQRGADVLFRLGEDVEFTLGTGSIECRLTKAESRWMVEPVLLTTGLALHLERAGVVALHGGAVRRAGRAAAFLAASTGGKSTLVASLVAAGGALVTDDVLALDEGAGAFTVRPSYPLIKLTAESARLFTPPELPVLVELFPGQPKRGLVVGPGGRGHFASEDSPLAALYLLDRRSGSASIALEAVSPRDAVVELIRQSFAPRLVEALGLAPRRLDFLARLAAAVPVKRLVYPSGLERLPEVHAALAADVGWPTD